MAGWLAPPLVKHVFRLGVGEDGRSEVSRRWALSLPTY
jgi:hypothetical protein